MNDIEKPGDNTSAYWSFERALFRGSEQSNLEIWQSDQSHDQHTLTSLELDLMKRNDRPSNIPKAKPGFLNAPEAWTTQHKTQYLMPNK